MTQIIIKMTFMRKASDSRGSWEIKGILWAIILWLPLAATVAAPLQKLVLLYVHSRKIKGKRSADSKYHTTFLTSLTLTPHHMEISLKVMLVLLDILMYCPLFYCPLKHLCVCLYRSTTSAPNRKATEMKRAPCPPMRSSCLCTRCWKGNHPSTGVFPPHLLHYHELSGEGAAAT